MNTKILNEYRRCAEICQNTDYDNANSVKEHNLAVKRMLKITEKAAKEGLDAITLLSTLLDEPLTQEWLAFQLLDTLTVPKRIETKCLSIIKNIASISSRHTNSFGAKVWLEKWNAKKADKDN